MENQNSQLISHGNAQSHSADFDAGEMTNSAAPPAFQLMASPVQMQVAQLQAEDLTAEELAAANTYNAGRYRYEAPDAANPDDQTSYQRLITMLHAVAENQTLYDNAAAATSVGAAFSHLVNAAQGELYPDDATKHDGQMGPETLRLVMAGGGAASTAIGLEDDGTFIPENAVTGATYPHFSNDRIGDFRVTGGFMEPHGHSQKGATDVLRTDGDWIEDAPLYNHSHVTAADLPNLIAGMHTIAQDDTLRDEATTANAAASSEFARLVYAAQLQLFTAANDIDGRMGPGTRAAILARSQYIDAAPVAAEGDQPEGAAPVQPVVDGFVYQMAPFTEMYETRHNTVQSNNTIGINFEMGAADAQARIEATGANYAEVVAGTASLTDDQINALYYADLQAYGVDRAAASIANYAALPLAAKMAVTDICFSFGTGAVTGMAAVFTALVTEDYHTAGDELMTTAFYTGEGNRGPRHLDAFKFRSSRSQDPRITTSAASDKNLGFDYVTEGTNTDEDVFAWYGGVVTKSGLEGGYGNRVTIETDIRYNYQGADYIVYTAYAHNDELFVSKGDFVESGDLIAEMGGTGSGGGTSYPAHVDFRTWIIVDGDVVDVSPNLLESQISAGEAADADPAPEVPVVTPGNGGPE
jgi:hypothetical protein